MPLSILRKADDGGAGGAPQPLPRGARPILGLALGAGAARGWAHIGVLREFGEAGILPDIVVGCSIGAVVGGCYVAGQLDAIETFARSLTKRRVFGYMDLSFQGGGLFGGRKLEAQLERVLAGLRIEDIGMRFGAVATELGTGHEIWLTRGNLVEGIRASYALPGIFQPVHIAGRWLVDGALVNPVPVTVCRALGAEMVIAVNLNADTLGRGTVIQDHLALERSAAEATEESREEGSTSFAASLLASMRGRGALRPAGGGPGIATVMIDAFNITQDRITRSRLAGDPPDMMIAAKLAKLGPLEFHRADEMIAAGREAARRAIPDIREQIGLLPAV